MTSNVNVPFNNLRAVVILIVVAFHAALPYLASQPSFPFAFDAEPYRWIAFPIIDQERWLGFDLFCAWQDVSLMTLMFFLAGLFVPASLGRKGSLAYLTDRWWRIGLPFVLAVAILSPLAYDASYRLTASDRSLSAFWQHWRALPMWPSGPQWFLWQLLLLSALGAMFHGFTPDLRDRLGNLAGSLRDRPLMFFAGLTALSALAYIPLALAFGPWEWRNIGPLSVQKCRPLLYAVYFFAAFAIGSRDLDRGILRINGPIARHWLAWFISALVSMSAWGYLTSLTLPDWDASAVAYRLAAASAFPLACVAGVLAYLAVALRLLHARSRLFDSLSSHAYGIYLVHYVFVLWLQYALLGARLDAPVKMLTVFSAAILLSWATSAGASAIITGVIRRSQTRSATVTPRRPTTISHQGAVVDQT